ncbi:MAG: peptidoglycan DD-metalloendopeptidase family protein [Chloroflexota bacterium]
MKAPQAAVVATLPPTAAPTMTPIRPPVVLTIIPPPVQQGVELPPVAAVAQTGLAPADVWPAASASEGNLPEATLTAAFVAAPTATATATPGPTFTPPASPTATGWEHLWLGRPVSSDTAVWTNKVYPYGSTRGGTLRPHHGVEFDVPSGTPIYAVAAGTVRVAGDDSLVAYGETTNFYGNLVVIELDYQMNGQPIFTLFGHLSELQVSVGQHVEAQTPIALSGASGVADGPHLHFEVRVGQNSYQATRNPLLWLYPFPGRGVAAGRVTWPDGTLAHEVPVSLRRLDAPSAYAATTTYAEGDLNGDDNWQENFALDDVTAGYYELTVGGSNHPIKTTFWVYPYQTSFVEVVLKGGE